MPALSQTLLYLTHKEVMRRRADLQALVEPLLEQRPASGTSDNDVVPVELTCLLLPLVPTPSGA